MLSIGRTVALGIGLVGVAVAAMAQEDRPSLSEITEAWLNSPHAQRDAEAFTHWNEDGEIPGNCAVCHSSIGAIEYLSRPITEAGVIDHPVGLGTSVDCTACHNSGAANLSVVLFPSGVSVEDSSPSAICTVCHQGRASTDTVISATEGKDEDGVSDELRFINVHYIPAGATRLGTEVRGGFEYPGKSYRGRFAHVAGFDTCTSCHSPHSLEVDIADCTTCHQNVERFEDIRISPIDFDGDGDTTEGIADPIGEMHARLEEAIRLYAAGISGVDIVYASGSYPYFFIDGNGDGSASAEEANFPNRYQSWTPRLLKAAYNYQLVAKDPAIYSHNPHYALQLLFDSLEDLSERVEVNMDGLTRP